MSADERKPRTEGEGFLGRWSRVKVEARETAAAPPVPEPVAPDADAGEPPELPPIDKLTIDSDFRGFFHPKVDEDLRRSALRKLFSDPHFNVMDGLDTYIDDYSKSEPLPAGMLASLKQAQRILEWAAETEDEAQARRDGLAAAESAKAAPERLPVPEIEPTLDEPAPDTPIAEPALEADPVPRKT